MLYAAYPAVLATLLDISSRVLFDIFKLEHPCAIVNFRVLNVGALAVIAERSQPTPLPVLRNLEGDFVVYAGGLGFTAFGVDTLLIVGTIGSVAPLWGLASKGNRNPKVPTWSELDQLEVHCVDVVANEGSEFVDDEH